jgi:hypothetical protein
MDIDHRPVILREQVRVTLLKLAAERSPKTFCPSEAARLMDTNWPPLMEVVREVGAELVEEGRLLCTQKGEPVDTLGASGAIRFSTPL